MALINCPECGKEISDMAPACPHCGYSSNPATAQKSFSEASKKNIKKWGIIGVIGITLMIMFILLIPKIKVAMLSAEEKCLYSGIVELRKDLLNEQSLQVKEIYVAMGLPEDEQAENIVVISYTAQNRGGGYTDDIVVYTEFKSGTKRLAYDRTEEFENVDIDTLSDDELNEIMKLQGETVTHQILLQTCLIYGEELSGESIEKVMKIF